MPLNGSWYKNVIYFLKFRYSRNKLTSSCSLEYKSMPIIFKNICNGFFCGFLNRVDLRIFSGSRQLKEKT